MALSTRTKLKVGRRYLIRFWDHCISENEEVVKCRLYGWLVSQDKNRISISTWEVEDSDPDTKTNNKELVNIVRAAIIEIRQLEV